MIEAIAESWRAALATVLNTRETQRLNAFLDAEEEAGKRIYPAQGQRLAALALTRLEAVKVVILGQDPYHRAGQAHGFSFSVPRGVKVPPSLANIFKEIRSDCGVPAAAHGDLTQWARQGVLLLNATLTVEEGRAGSHRAIGWQAITQAVLAAVAAKREPCVFMLWGNHARQTAQAAFALENTHHLVLAAPHPSPLSAYTGFFGCRHFSQANDFLRKSGRGTIDWRLE